MSRYGRRARRASGSVVRPLNLADIELLAAHENVHDALCLRRVAAAHEPAERVRDDLPRQPVFVLEPTALTGLAPIGRELRPVLVDLLLGVAADEKGHRLIEPVHRPGVECDELLPLELELDGHDPIARPVDRQHLRAWEDGCVEVHGVFGLRVEPEKWSDARHGWLLLSRELS